ncbi:hypothetical protein AGMMS50262_10280 [Bacteroidia bacterium]|nr:hypothetical protein AGMMS50262_10280 [Bacteroidia bacterium]
MLNISMLFSQSDNGRQTNWKEDIAFLKTELPQKHKNLFFQLDRQSFEESLDKLSAKTDTMNNMDVLLSLQQILAKVGDSHTNLKYQLDKAKSLPLKLYWFDDGIFVLATTKEHERILGYRLTGVGDYPITKVIDSLKTLIVQDNNALNKKGVLYVIIGRQTFSSAIINTMDFKKETKAIILGEETGGMPNHYGEVRSFTLPVSGITVQYSTKYFQHIEEKLNTITPDIKAGYNFNDYINGIDPSMNEIMKV